MLTLTRREKQVILVNPGTSSEIRIEALRVTYGAVKVEVTKKQSVTQHSLFEGERLPLSKDADLVLTSSSRSQAKLSFEAPKRISIWRQEIWIRKQLEAAA